MSLPAACLRRARRPDGQPVWVWTEDERGHELEFGATGEGLAAAAEWLLAGAADRAAALERAPAVDAARWPTLRPGRPGKALCLGKNFAAHAREFGAEPPEELVWFAKLPNVLIGPGETVRIPDWLGTRVDPEAEVVALVGAPLFRAGAAEARAAIAGYTLGNDVTARKQQGEDRKRGWPWLRCKNLATFGPIGPAWVPADAVPDLADRVLRGRVNDEVRQEAALGDLIWPPAEALAEISRWTPLLPGDLVFLGTPAGVAPVAPGDRMVVECAGLGRLENPVASG